MFLLICLYLIVLGLPCCSLAFSGYGKWGLLSSGGVCASHHGDFSCYTAQALEYMGSVDVVDELSSSETCGSFPNQESNQVPCSGRQFPKCWSTGEVHFLVYYVCLSSVTQPS